MLSYMAHEEGIIYDPKAKHKKYNNSGVLGTNELWNVDVSLLDLSSYLTSTPKIVHGEDFDYSSDPINLKDESSLSTARGIVAGVMTTDNFAREFYNNGTNRRATQYVFRNFLCKEFEDISDTTVDAQYVRRDVDRYPNGDTNKYLNYCVGCHAGQDSLGRAFYHYENIGQGGYLVYRLNNNSFPNANQENKLNRIVNFEDGYFVGNDSNGDAMDRMDYWENLWIKGRNSDLGWALQTMKI